MKKREIRLNTNNIKDIEANASKYNNFNFIVDGNDIHDGRKLYNWNIIKLVSMSKKYNYSMSLINAKSISKIYKGFKIVFPINKEIKDVVVR